MYSREYNGESYNLEPSGGLINGALVMQDRETDSYWSLMSNEVISGKLKGVKIDEIPVGEKTQWRDWVKRHPDTKVLSIKGREDAPPGYLSYFDSERGFRGLRAKDNRLDTKTPIYAFELNGKRYAVPHQAIVQGKTLELGEQKIFLYRPQNAEVFKSSAAFISTGSGFEKVHGQWLHIDSGCTFSPDKEKFITAQKGECPQPMEGFDTFWYTWSLTHPDTEVLGLERR